MDYKKPLSIVMFTILAASTFTIVTPLTLFNVQEAEAQGLQLRISAAERPQFENHFFGGQIVQVIIDDPGATDPDESTVGLVINGFNSFKVHLSDGLWYTYFAEDQGFAIFMDVLTDGIRDNSIAISDAANDAGSPVLIGGTNFAITLGNLDSFVKEIEVVGGFPHAELTQADIFPTLPPPFFQGGTTINPDLTIGVLDEDAAVGGDTLGVNCQVGGADDAGGVTLSTGGNGDPDCDWPYVRLIGLEETSTVEIRAGSASVTLIFDDFADSIVSSLDRTTDYPLRAEVINSYTDFMWNFNPVEEDSVFFVLNRATGDPTNILVQPVPGFDPAGNGQNFPDLFPAFTSSPGLEFDERQVQELDQEGVQVLGFSNAFSVANNALVTFVQEPFVRIFENSRTVAQFDAAVNVFNTAGVDIGPAVAGDLLPVIPMFEGDPNVSVFDNTLEAAGGRASLFTAVNDRVASFDYFDIIASAPMTTHDGFTSVDREVYDSADRAIFTVTDPDNNLRSKISEEPTGRESSSFIRVGAPFPLVNTRTGATISNPAIDTVTRMWAATFLQAGDGVGAPDATTFGIAGGGAGANVFADVDNGPAGAEIDMGFGVGEGTERFHAADDDIVAIPLVDDNRQIALVFTPPLIGGSPATAIIVDTTLTVDQIDDFVDIQDITGSELLGQVRLDNIFDNSNDQVENFLVNVATIVEPGGGILGQTSNLGIVAGTIYDVRMPRYNLVNVDLTDLQSQFTLGDVVVKIDIVDATCVPAGAAPLTTVAFAETCVHASQVVDFQLIEAAPSVDTDGVATTGDDTNDPIKDIADAPVAEGGIDVWSSQITDAIEPAVDEETGFDRDPLTGRIGLGSFRALDLANFADLNDDGLANNSHLTDRVRVTLLILSSGDAPSVAAGFAQDEPLETILAQNQRVVIDIAGLGIVFDPAPTDETPDNIASQIGFTFSNLAYRLELDEEGSNSSIFTGRADFMTFLQLDTVTDVINDIVLTGDPLKIWLPNRFIPPNRLAFNNLDEDIVQFFREVSATFIYETRDGSLEWDRSSFSFGQDAFLTITDEDLNRRPDATERYNLPVDGFVFFELGKVRVCADTIDANPPAGVSDCPFDNFATAAFANQIDATLLETGPNTGTFVAQITMPRSIITDATPGDVAGQVNAVTQQQDLEANYIDIRDRSSVRQEFDDITNIRTTLGDVVLDRAAYPPGALMFVEIHDNDFNTDVDIRETINLAQIVITNPTTAASGWGVQTEGTTLGGAAVAACDTAAEFVTAACANAAPIFELTIFQTGVGRLVTLLPIGVLDSDANGVPAAAALNDRFGTGVNTNAILPILDRSGIPVTTALETGPNTGIFEFEIQLPGPAFDVDQFPITLPAVLTAGTVEQPVIDANQPIQATYFDPADESGETEDEEELATFLFNTARLRTDKLEYGLGEPVEIIVEEPDFNRDSRSIDEVSFSILDIITDKFDTEDEDDNNFACVVREGPTAILDACDAGNFGAANGLRTNLTNLRETGFNTGVFAVQLEEILESLVDRGEDVELIYRDLTPSGGGAEIRIEYEFLVVEILPEIIFDKEEYTPFDEFIVSIISPDSNQDPDRIETIRPLISSSSASLGRQSFPETGPNTGIFEEDFDLTPDPTRFPGDLQAIREDGVTVEFRIDEDTVATKSVFVNYHVGQVMFDKDAFRISERGVMRVIDPDANRNPDTIDTTEVRFWSTTDRGGLLVVLRETGDRTGIFEEIITFTPDEESTGTRLRVTEGDTITAKFTDNTLPAPAALDADETFTVEVEELFASALIGSIVPPLERAVASEIELVDQTGSALTDVTAGSQVLIQSEIVNSQTKKQPFAYIVQIKDENDVTVSLSWVTGELPEKDSLRAAQSWIPDAPGDYTVEVFVWASVDNPDPLSPTRTTQVSVS